MEIQSVDLSTKPKSFTAFLISIIPTLHKKSIEEIIELIQDSKDQGIHVSENYLKKVIDKIDELKASKARVLKYIADIALKGSDLGVVTSQELVEKLASIYGSNDEALIAIVSSTMKKKADLVSNIKQTWEAANSDIGLFSKRLMPFINRYLSTYKHPKDINEMREAILEATDQKARLINRSDKWMIAPPLTPAEKVRT